MRTTEKVYYEDQYLMECPAHISRLYTEAVELNRTVAFPEGGGQEADHGVIETPVGAIRFEQVKRMYGLPCNIDGFRGVKTGGVDEPLKRVQEIRKEVGADIDIMVDIHGPPWLTTKDAIRMGQALEEYDLLFYEDPTAPENIESIARVQQAVNLPIAAGERHANVWGVRELIEREIIDVVQPDTGRAGGLSQMKKMAALAEAHYVTFAPHDGSLGPVAEMAAVHLCSTLPNFLILEHLEDDVPQRYEVMQPQPEIVDGHIIVPDAPGLGVDIVEDAIAKYPSQGNISAPDPDREYVYFQARYGRSRWLNP